MKALASTDTLLLMALQACVILLVAMGLLWLLRRREASLRHAVLALALGCVAIVPAVSVVVPPWLGEEFNLPSVSAVMPAPALRHAAVEVGPVREPSESAVPAGEPGPATSPPTLVGPPAPADWMALGRTAYAAGLIAALAVLALELARVAWLAARSVPMRSRTWRRHAAAVARIYGLRRRVQLKQGAHPTLLATWGVLRPEVLLPAGAEHWPEERIRAVLLHELAHIRRNDWLMHLLAATLRAVHWFNPLVWMACRRMRLESELACDDAVLVQGVARTDYADELLALARSMSRPALMLGPAPAMARSSTLRRRIANVLDVAAVRTGGNRAALAWAATFMLLTTSLIAACSSATSPQDQDLAAMAAPQADAAAPPAAATPADAVPVEALPDATAPASGQAHALQGPVDAGARPAGVAGAATPLQVVTGILDLIHAAQADGITGRLDDITRPITGLRHVERYALAVVTDEGQDPGLLAANGVEIINALVNTGNMATNIRRQAGAAQLPPEPFERLGAAMHARARELSQVLMPVVAMDLPVASTPENRAAARAKDLARTTLSDVSFVGPRQGSWLVTELDTLERAAAAVLNSQDAGGRATPFAILVLQNSLRSTARQASQIAGRADRPAVNRDKAAALVQSLQGLEAMLIEALSSQAVDGARDPLAGMLARVAGQVQGLQLVTLRRSENTFIALLGDGGPAPINVTIEEAGSEAEAIRNEERSVLLTSVMGRVESRNGLRLNTWGGDGDAMGYRVQARLGTRVVNISAPPALGRYVLPILDGIAAQVR